MELISYSLITFGCIFFLMAIIIYIIAHSNPNIKPSCPQQEKSIKSTKRNSKIFLIASILMIISGAIMNFFIN